MFLNRRPGLEHRHELVGNICRKIPLSEAAQHYLAGKTEDYAPAQIQEIIFSLVIQHPDEQAEIDVARDEKDRLISRINGRSRQSMGFKMNGNGNHNGNDSDLSKTVRNLRGENG